MGTNMSEEHPLRGLGAPPEAPQPEPSTGGTSPTHNHQQPFGDIQNIFNSNQCDNSHISNSEQSLKNNYTNNGSKCENFKYNFQNDVNDSTDNTKLDCDQNVGHLYNSDKVDSDLVSDFDDNKPDTVSADSEDSALGSLACEPSALPGDDEPQDRSDGSDSGLGSELPEDPRPFHTLPQEVTLSDQTITVDGTNFENFEILNNNSETSNRKLEDPLSLTQFSDVTFLSEVSQVSGDKRTLQLKSTLKRKLEIEEDDAAPKLKKKKCLTFDDVTVYYFPRAQGFTCIPSQGGSTLGMAGQHTHQQKFTLPEHTLEQRRLHRQILQQLRSEKHLIQGSSVSSSDYSDSEDEPSEISESELDLDSYYFLQPVPTRQRRALLRAAGVRKIEAMEKDDCRDIRSSRELCGCSCKGYCDPETCSCSQNGIKCQVDRLNFPCGCTRDGCGNTTGRIEFNPVRVRTHFIHTLMRIGLEKKAEENLSKVETVNEHLQWNNSSNRLLPSSSYQGDCEATTNKYNGNLLRDVNLSSHVEVESCANSGTFSNMHYDVNPTKTVPNLQCREDALDLYTFREDCYNEESRINLNQDRLTANTPSQQIDNFSNLPKAKGNFNNQSHIAYSGNSSIARFPCEMSFPYTAAPDASHYPPHQQYSAASFETFSQQPHVFNHYNYMNEYIAKPTNTQDTNTNILEYSNVQTSGTYGTYRTPETVCFPQENKDVNQYTNLHTPAYPINNKLESFSELIQGRYSFNSYEVGDVGEQSGVLEQGEPPHVPAQETPVEPPPQPVIPNESDENFGEIIKKTMVENAST